MFIFDKDTAKKRIAIEIAQRLNKMAEERNIFVNLGVGIPTMVADHINNPRVFLQAENGMLGVGPAADEEHADPQLINAGRIKVTETPGCSYFDSSVSFGMIRGGHIDATVIGAFQVDQSGNVANWIIPNGKMLGVGGAMDLVAGAKQVYIAMQHTERGGTPKLVRNCSLPITGYGKVSIVVTEFAVFRFIHTTMYLESIAPEITLDELKVITPAEYVVSPELSRWDRWHGETYIGEQ